MVDIDDLIQTLKDIPWYVWLIIIVIFIAGLIISPWFIALIIISPLDDIIIIILFILFVKLVYDNVVKGGKK